ncbi:MAG TPA: type III pantothenate kinase [Acidimicrobiales bacterium]|jgi:type III pantothenate kinase|nr:type III pantothenate kinase [Acidimicrobiales bacterium]
MLLVIDVGNTQTVIGLYDLEPDDAPNVGRLQADTHLLDHWRVATNAERTADEQALVVQEFLGFHGFSFDDDIAGICLCSSVPRVTGALRRMAERYFGQSAIVIEPGIRTGVPILYDNPKEVGADRIADAVAALDLFGGPVVSVDFGTATTFDAISAKGEYLGGSIFPGIDISLDALFARAAALRRVELIEPRNVIGRSTVESIQSGVIYGYTGLVDSMVTRIEAELGEKATVVSTGGLAGLITPLSSTITHHEPWLTLHGLRLIYEKNQQ